MGVVVEQLASRCELGRHIGCGEQSVVANADEASGQHMQDQTTKKLDRSHACALFVARTKPDVLLIDVQQAPVADADAMCVPTEVSVDGLRAAERGLAVDMPAL
jgi:hypothetical protein